MPDISIHRALASAMKPGTPKADASSSDAHTSAVGRLQKVDLGHPSGPSPTPPKATPVNLGHPATPLPGDIHVSDNDGNPVFDKSGRF